MIMDWSTITAALPGIVVEDQDPDGCGLAISIESVDASTWIIHTARDQHGEAVIQKTAPLSAFHLYQTLEKLYAAIGYTPELSAVEYDMLQLPPKKTIAQESLAAKMPGTYLGLPPDEEGDLGWITHYSVVALPKGNYKIYTGVLSAGDDFLAEPEIDLAGTTNLSETLDELRIAGFSEDALLFLRILSAPSRHELQNTLPGERLNPPPGTPDDLYLSICRDGDDSWKIFSTRKKDEARFFIDEERGLDARQTYKSVFSHLHISIPETVASRVHLPSMEKLFHDSLAKKLKGFWLGSVNGEDDACREQQRFVSIQQDPKTVWTVYYILAEDVLSGSRKFTVHHAEPFTEEEIYTAFEKLDPTIDPLELYAKMVESKIVDIAELAKRFEEQMETGQ
jgi:hypothetical protein